jgi:hypothetical protein
MKCLTIANGFAFCDLLLRAQKKNQEKSKKRCFYAQVAPLPTVFFGLRKKKN